MDSTRTDWFCKAKWGLFMHFLSSSASVDETGGMTTAKWNEMVDGFDVEALAGQLNELQAGYFFITVGQNSGYFCAPNKAYDDITKISPSKCSKRDLVADLYKALDKHGVPLMVYLPSHAPMSDPEAVRALKCVPPWDFSAWSPPDIDVFKDDVDPDVRIAAFQRNWESIIREWSMQWGGNVHGWWFDGCYYADKLYRNANEPNFKSFAKAVRSGNPESIVAWNAGWPPIVMDDAEDYTAGETSDPEKVEIYGRFVRQNQFHVLSYMSTFWGRGPARFSPEKMIELTRAVTDYGGVFTWDIPFTANGLIQPDCFQILKKCSKGMNARRGLALKQAPRVARVDFHLKRPPFLDRRGGCLSGQLALEVSNPFEESISGNLDISLSPANCLSLSETGSLRYELAPADSQKILLKLAPLPGAVNFKKAELSVKRKGAVKQYRSEIPIRKELVLEVYPDGASFIMKAEPMRLELVGKELAEIRLGVCASSLAIHVKVVDKRMEQCPGSWWNGSCIEFFSAPRDGAQIAQFFLIPETKKAKAGVYQWGKKGASGIELKTTKTENGYAALTLIPFEKFLGTATAARFLFELSVNSRELGRAVLFDSPQAYADTSWYGAAIVAIPDGCRAVCARDL